MKPEISTPSGDWDNCPLCRWPQEQCKCGAATPIGDQGSASSASGDVAQSAGERLLVVEETLDLIRTTLDKAPMLPLDECTPNGLRDWTDAIITVMKNVAAEHITRAAPLTRGGVGNSTLKPPEAAGSGDTATLHHRLTKYYAKRNAAAAPLEEDLAPGLNATNDLVRRLRETAGLVRRLRDDQNRDDETLCDEAADRIEQLQRDALRHKAMWETAERQCGEQMTTIERLRKVIAELVACEDQTDRDLHNDDVVRAAWANARRELQE